MHLLTLDLPVSEKLIRTVIVYVFMLVGLRLAGKRELSQLNPFDLVVLLLLSNTVQNAIIGNDNSLAGGLVGAAVLLVFNYIVVRFLYEHPTLDKLAEGDADILVRDGVIQDVALHHDLITIPEIEASARRQGIPSLTEIEECRIEVGGALTFVQKRPTCEDMRHRELLDRLTRIEKQLAALEERLPGAPA